MQEVLRYVLWEEAVFQKKEMKGSNVFKPNVELLEDRCTPAVFSLTNPFPLPGFPQARLLGNFDGTTRPVNGEFFFYQIASDNVSQLLLVATFNSAGSLLDYRSSFYLRLDAPPADILLDDMGDWDINNDQLHVDSHQASVTANQITSEALVQWVINGQVHQAKYNPHTNQLSTVVSPVFDASIVQILNQQTIHTDLLLEQSLESPLEGHSNEWWMTIPPSDNTDQGMIVKTGSLNSDPIFKTLDDYFATHLEERI